MLLFASPILLAALPLVAAFGLWALWHGKHRRHLVSSTRLWSNLLNSPTGDRKRSIDPVWLLVFLAALLAALALPGPSWRIHPQSVDVPSAQVRWSVRSIGANPPELFVQVAEPHNLPPDLVIEYNPTPRVATAGGHFATADALRGVILNAPLSGEENSLTLHVSAGGTLLSAATFNRPDRPPFALLTRLAAGRRIDPALYRVFAVNPAARVDDPTLHPAVLLVDDPAFNREGLAPDTLVIASATTPLPGITLQTPFSPINPTPLRVSLPPYIQLNQVQVTHARAGTLSGEWNVLATLDDHPFLAIRKMSPVGPTLVWLASAPATETNWPLDRSFVLTFSHILAQTFPPPRVTTTASASGDTRIDDWSRRDLPLPASATASTGIEIPLRPALGIGAIGLLLAAIIFFARRGRAA